MARQFNATCSVKAVTDFECIAVSYGYGTEEELENAHPYKIVNSAEEILDFFA